MQQEMFDIPKEVKIEENEKQEVKDPIYSFKNIAKFFALSTVITGTFGLCYQKGAIESMQLGNLSGNYTVEEIFNSALMGYVYILNNATKVKAVDIALELFAPMFTVAFILATVLYFIYKKRCSIRTWATKAKSMTVDNAKNMPAIIQLLATWIGALIGSIVLLVVHISGIYALLTFFAVLLLPAVFGYSIGSEKVAETMEKPPCIAISETNKKSKHIRQCTHVSIGGKQLSGMLILENKSGYYMRLNEGFIYASKDGKTCIYSKDTIRKKVNPNTFVFPRGQVDEFCGIPRPKEKEQPKPEQL